MRAGALDRIIVIQRGSDAPAEYGTIITAWSDLATVRAQLVQTSTTEFIRNYGSSSEAVTVFRIRHLAGVTLADRVQYEGAAFNIVEIKEIGRREGLELRCERIGS